MSKTLQIIAEMTAKAGQASALRSTLTSVVADFRAEPGCQGYILLEDNKHAGRFLTYETWTDEASLAQHMTSPAMLALAPKMKELLEGDIRQEFLTIVRAT